MFSVSTYKPLPLKKTSPIVFGLTLLVGIAGLWMNARADDAAPRAADPIYYLTSVRIIGNDAVASRDIRKILKLKTPRKVRDSMVMDSCRKLFNEYGNRGFLDVKMSTAIVDDQGGKALVVNLQEGPVFHVGSLDVQGNKELSKHTVLREIEMAPGDVLNKGKLLEGNKRLYSSGCFDFVDMVVSSVPVNRINVLIKVRERQQRFLKGGAGYGSQSKERVTAGFEDRNFLGGARRLDMQYTLSGFITQPDKYRTTLFDTTVVQPFIFHTRMEAQLGYEREGQLRQAYDSVSNTIHSSLERRVSSELSVKGTYRFSGTYLSRVSPDADTPSQTSIDAPGITLRYDNTDDPFLPFRGWRSITLFEEGLEIYKTDIGFHKLETRLGRFDTTFSGWTFFEGLQFGNIRPWSGKSSDAIPIYERYFLGGANTVRGYSERSLGPKDSAGNPLGGTLFLVGNFEIRHRMYKQLFGVVFLDGGNLYAYDPGDPSTDVKINSLGDLKYSTGAGLRLHSPIGAIRLEAGYQLNPDGNPSTLDRFALHFSIGEVF